MLASSPEWKDGIRSTSKKAWHMLMFVLAPNNECTGLTKRSSGKILAVKTNIHTVRRNMRNNDIESYKNLEV